MFKTTPAGGARRAVGVSQSEGPLKSENPATAARRGAAEEHGTSAGSSQEARLVFSSAQRAATKPTGDESDRSDAEDPSFAVFPSSLSLRCMRNKHTLAASVVPPSTAVDF